MRLTTFLLADHAEAANGKLYVTGGAWNTITVSELPSKHPHLTVAAVLHVPASATDGQHQMRLDILDEEDHSLLAEPAQGSFEAGRPPGMRPGDDAVIVSTFNLNGLLLQRPGRHDFVLEVDGVELGRIGFRVLVAAPASTTS